MQTMRILIVSDVHGVLSQVRRLKVQVPSTDLVLLAGDLTHFGPRDTAITVLEELSTVAPVLYVPGNCDYPDYSDLTGERYRSVHRRAVKVEEYWVVGFGGSPHTPFLTPNEYSEEEIEEGLRESLSTVPREEVENLILLTHAPPRGTDLDLTVSGTHAGSLAVRRIVEEYQPLLHVCGHIHEGRGVVRLGRTQVVNPGPLRRGFYALAEVRGGEVSLRLEKLP